MKLLKKFFIIFIVLGIIFFTLHLKFIPIVNNKTNGDIVQANNFLKENLIPIDEKSTFIGKIITWKNNSEYYLNNLTVQINSSNITSQAKYVISIKPHETINLLMKEEVLGLKINDISLIYSGTNLDLKNKITKEELNDVIYANDIHAQISSIDFVNENVDLTLQLTNNTNKTITIQKNNLQLATYIDLIAKIYNIEETITLEPNQVKELKIISDDTKNIYSQSIVFDENKFTINDSLILYKNSNVI